MARQENAGTIINRAAVEVGLQQVSDPFSTTDEGFSQLVGLLNVAGNELTQLRDWAELTKELAFNTGTDLTNNRYDLPADYDRFIQQTGWDKTNDVALIGPLSPQEWAYLEGRDLASNTVYLHYRINAGAVQFYPDPAPTAEVSFRYVNRNWVRQADSTETDQCTQASDTVLLDSLLMQKFLKVKFLSMKNMPNQDAKLEFENILINRFGTDKGAMVLNASCPARGVRMLSMWNNVGDTGYGV